jgi:hypothetical protein
MILNQDGGSVCRPLISTDSRKTITRNETQAQLRDELLQTAREALSASAPQPPAKPRKTRSRGASDPES